MLYADPCHSYCVALVVVSQPALEEWAQSHGVEFNNLSDLCKKYEAIKEVQSSLAKVCIMNFLLILIFFYNSLQESSLKFFVSLISVYIYRLENKHDCRGLRFPQRLNFFLKHGLQNQVLLLPHSS